MAKASERAWLLTSGWCGTFAYPVDVLSRGPKRATVRLRHMTIIGTKRLPAGTVKRGVPVEALGSVLPERALVSRGRGRFRAQ